MASSSVVLATAGYDHTIRYSKYYQVTILVPGGTPDHALGAPRNPSTPGVPLRKHFTSNAVSHANVSAW